MVPTARRPVTPGRGVEAIVEWADRRSAAFWGLASITAVAVALRVFFLVSYRPGLIGYSDTANYLLYARGAVFGDPVRVAGYVLFLKLLHLISPHLILVTGVQHAFGIACGILLFDAVRRGGLPAWLGLVPAAVVMLGGSQLILEHTILTDTLFLFLITLAMWAVVRAWTGSGWWAVLVGFSAGCSTIVRTVGVELLPVTLLCLCLRPARSVPIAPDTGAGASGFLELRRLRAAHPVLVWRSATLVAAVLSAALAIVPFLDAHDVVTGSFNYTSEGNLQLYGRVAPWADCSKFTPPPGTAKLCIYAPVAQRGGSQVWEFSSTSPVSRAYGFIPPKDANSQLEAFAVAAIEGQPLTYLEYVGRGLLRIIDPSFPTSPYPGVGNDGYGPGPEGDLDWYFGVGSNLAGVEGIINSYYKDSGLFARNVAFFEGYDRDTRIEGPVMVVLLILALIAPFVARGLPRRLAILFTATSAVLLIGPILVVDYDWRYVVPALGALSASATIGAYGTWIRVAPRLRRHTTG